MSHHRSSSPYSGFGYRLLPPSSSVVSSTLTTLSSSLLPAQAEDDEEEEGLRAARRALWSDVVIIPKPPRVEMVVLQSEDQEEGEKLEPGEVDWEWGTPVHKSLPSSPLAPCLRLSSTPSLNSSLSCISSTSFINESLSEKVIKNVVSFNEITRIESTYSKELYPRTGMIPLDKLTIREWVELQGVREGLGLWSGKLSRDSPVVVGGGVEEEQGEKGEEEMIEGEKGEEEMIKGEKGMEDKLCCSFNGVVTLLH